MTEVALFDVVIPGVIAWVLIDDLLRSVKNSQYLEPVLEKISESKANLSATAKCLSEPCSFRG